MKLARPTSTARTRSCRTWQLRTTRALTQHAGFLLVLQLSVGACTSSADAPGQAGSSGSGPASSGSGSGAQAGTLGGSGASGTSGLGGASAGMGGGGAAMTAAGTGGAGGSGGVSGNTTGGAAGAAAGGAAGSAGAGGANLDPGDSKAAAMVLDGLALIKPCNDNVTGCCCNEDPMYENQHIVKMFGGNPNVTYNVKLRIAGVAERYWYTGGTVDPVGKLFYTGGLPTVNGPPPGTTPRPSACKIQPPKTDGPPDNFALGFTVPPEVNPSDGCFNGFNIFAMTVSSPKKSYYLNYTEAFDGSDRQPHACYTNDYTVTIPIKGQAQLDFYVIDGDHHQVANDGTQMVPNVKTKQPYHGNFLEFAVVDVTPAATP